MFDISPIQILIVLVIALLVFGPKRLPDLGRNLGASIRDFRGAISGDDDSSRAGASTETGGARDETETELKRIIAASNAGDAEPVARA